MSPSTHVPIRSANAAIRSSSTWRSHGEVLVSILTQTAAGEVVQRLPVIGRTPSPNPGGAPDWGSPVPRPTKDPRYTERERERKERERERERGLHRGLALLVARRLSWYKTGTSARAGPACVSTARTLEPPDPQENVPGPAASGRAFLTHLSLAMKGPPVRVRASAFLKSLQTDDSSGRPQLLAPAKRARSRRAVWNPAVPFLRNRTCTRPSPCRARS